MPGLFTTLANDRTDVVGKGFVPDSVQGYGRDGQLTLIGFRTGFPIDVQGETIEVRHDLVLVPEIGPDVGSVDRRTGKQYG